MNWRCYWCSITRWLMSVNVSTTGKYNNLNVFTASCRSTHRVSHSFLRCLTWDFTCGSSFDWPSRMFCSSNLTLWREPKEGNYFTHNTKGITNCLHFRCFADGQIKCVSGTMHIARSWVRLANYCLHTTRNSRLGASSVVSLSYHLAAINSRLL